MFDVDTNLLNTAGLVDENSFFLYYRPSLKLFFLFCFAMMMKRRKKKLCDILLSSSMTVSSAFVKFTKQCTTFCYHLNQSVIWICTMNVNMCVVGFAYQLLLPRQCNYSRFILFCFTFFFIIEVKTFFILHQIFFYGWNLNFRTN